MPAVKITHFVVNGAGSFPTDMLRHDSCWPTSTRDVDLMDVSQERRTVKLTTYRPENITDARWASFGWLVSAA